MEFKIGDRVTVTNDAYGTHIGMTGTVIPEPEIITQNNGRFTGKPIDFSDTIWVRPDDWDGISTPPGFYASEIKKI